MNRKVIHHVRDLQSQRLLATVVAFDTHEGVKVGWSIANWSASGKKESVFVAGMEIVDFTPQPSKKLGVTYAILNAATGINPTVRRKAYVRHIFEKTDLMQEIYKIAENLRNFLENPRKTENCGKEPEYLEQEPFAYTYSEVLGDCCGGGCPCDRGCEGTTGGCTDPLLAPSVMLTCFESSEFTVVTLAVMRCLEELHDSVERVTDAFRDFCNVGASLEVVDIDEGGDIGSESPEKSSHVEKQV